jgi:hypothetical protein|tara:strand:- start:585 stop:764 length:180 start_codon:yes stop_codon:yes gene_type:complete
VVKYLGVGIAGAQDYVPAVTQEGWICYTCKKRYTAASAKAWIEKGLQQQCKTCYEKEKK